ncbi:hypothetical protein GWI33_003969 [Rhynchophorus ferrugineus]|uniref:Uncharacterized protein n=1 Tax=Rhynchophorus ferrugineus TaxID=354439 RepID=A0A834IMU0_RHYFE|nr:hypothetical protein GWI33_003969 [Rhynchophorus ferrugineus]
MPRHRPSRPNAAFRWCLNTVDPHANYATPVGNRVDLAKLPFRYFCPATTIDDENMIKRLFGYMQDKQ